MQIMSIQNPMSCLYFLVWHGLHLHTEILLARIFYDTIMLTCYMLETEIFQLDSDPVPCYPFNMKWQKVTSYSCQRQSQNRRSDQHLNVLKMFIKY